MGSPAGFTDAGIQCVGSIEQLSVLYNWHYVGIWKRKSYTAQANGWAGPMRCCGPGLSKIHWGFLVMVVLPSTWVLSRSWQFDNSQRAVSEWRNGSKQLHAARRHRPRRLRAPPWGESVAQRRQSRQDMWHSIQKLIH